MSGSVDELEAKYARDNSFGADDIRELVRVLRLERAENERMRATIARVRETAERLRTDWVLGACDDAANGVRCARTLGTTVAGNLEAVIAITTEV